MILPCCQKKISTPISYFSSFCDPVKTIALKVLKEFAASFLFYSIVLPFVAPMGHALLMQALIVQTVASFFFQLIGMCIGPKALKVGEWLSSFSFAFLSGYNLQSLIHEAGHALAALLVYLNPRPSIILAPFAGGHTQFFKTKLSSFGLKLGPKMSTFFIVISGPGLTLLVSSLIFVIGLRLLNQGSSLGKYLFSFASLDFLQHIFYAYSATYAPSYELSHDFVRLSILGLNPLVAAVAIAAIPLILYAKYRKA